MSERAPDNPATSTGAWRIRTERELETARGERERALEALRESEARFRTLFESSPNGIFLTDPETLEVLDCNTAACTMNGYAREELLGRSINVLHPGDVVSRMGGAEEREAFVERLRTAGPVTVESVHVRKDGSRFPLETSMCLLQLGGRPVVMGIDRDITERRRVEAELARYRENLEEQVAVRTAELAVAKDRAEAADRLKSAFLATMSHELRTPLNSIIGFTGVLLKGLVGPLNDEQVRQLGMVRTSAHHLLALINDVLDLSKIEAGQLRLAFAPFPLGEVVNESVRALQPAAERKGLALRSEVAPDVGVVVSDRRRVEQVLLNLLSNAVKFTDAGGVTLRAVLRGERLAVSVADTGIGIAPDDLTRIFRPFHQLEAGLTRRYEGTGLGLSICRRLAELLGGDIGVESEPGRGSTFTFSFPVRPEAP